MSNNEGKEIDEKVNAINEQKENIKKYICEFDKQLEWLRNAFNEKIDSEIVDKIQEAFFLSIDNKPLDQELKDFLANFVFNFLKSLTSLIVFSNLTEKEKKDINFILVFLYNLSSILEANDLIVQIEQINSLLNESMNLVETMKTIKVLVAKIAPFLINSSADIDSSRLFLEKIDKYYANLCEESNS
jgi:hypothetical protein